MTDVDAGHEKQDWKKSPGLFAAVMAVFLWGIVLLLNGLGSGEIPIVEAQFQELLKQDLVVRIQIEVDGLHCHLARQVHIENEGGRYLTEKVSLRRGESVGSEEIETWRAKEIVVVFEERTAAWGWQDGGGVFLVIVLLGIGIWHLWAQVKQDRHGIGSPRRRLKQLEEEFQAGRISAEEYQRQSEVLWAEM